VAIVSSADETARNLYQVLVTKKLLRDKNLGAPAHQFLATGDVSTFAPLAKRFLGPEVANVQKV
jgi:glutamate racemase